MPALALLGRAHDEFARADVDGAAPWAAFIDVHDMARSRTFALISLSLNHLVEADADEAAIVAGLAVALITPLPAAPSRAA